MNFEIKKFKHWDLTQNSKFKIQNSPQAAFTLIEMLVVVFIAGVGLVGALAFFNANIGSQAEAKNELIAAGLAQEGADLVRNIAENNDLNGRDWYSGLCSQNCKFDKTSNLCRAIDYTSLVDQNCENKIKICYSEGRYYECPNMGNANETDFVRDIDIWGENLNGINEVPGDVDLNAGDCMNVSVKVSWGGRSTMSKDIICKPRQ